MNRTAKILLAIFLAILSLILTALASFFIITAGSNLQPQKLVDYNKTISVFDDQSQKIEDAAYETKQRSVKIANLNDHTIKAFIASEDRNFYSHNGLNYKRMLKAAYKNVVSRSFKEGASTISQQLIKNTHLNNDKKITRKLKEIKLTKQLERRYSKDEILEMYLNTIYFGHNCFGLQNAANFYFAKPASQLTLEQSATMVGLLTSPNNFSPYKNPQKSILRRNTVLKNMLDCSFIDRETYEETVALPLSVAPEGNRHSNSPYLHAVFNEFEELNIDPYGQFDELHIKTYYNRETQASLESQKIECDYSFFVRNADGGVAAFKSSIADAKRQIGSTAKPLFVYAPAIDGKKLDLFTKIKDEPINYGGYSPENYDKTYHGQVTVKDSIKYSYNVPAVKALNSLSFDEVENYASKMGVQLSKEEKNLSLALGGMKEGLSLKQLCDCYSVFSNNGNYVPSRFIKEISDQSGKILYSAKDTKNKVFSEGTCSLINDALCDTAQTGTAKKLADLGFEVACKTGTCGNKDGNTDAYSVAYTSDCCIGVWLGSKDNKRLEVTGGRDCCAITKSILEDRYKEQAPAPLDRTSGTATIEIDREEYENNDRILLCDAVSPKLNRLSVKCLENNVPTQTSTRFTTPNIKKPSILVKNNQVNISLCQAKYYTYIVKRHNGNKTDTIYSGIWKANITDSPADGEYRYTVTPQYEYGGKIYEGEEIELPRVIIRSERKEDKLPDIAFKDWYNQ